MKFGGRSGVHNQSDRQCGRTIVVYFLARKSQIQSLMVQQQVLQEKH